MLESRFVPLNQQKVCNLIKKFLKMVAFLNLFQIKIETECFSGLFEQQQHARQRPTTAAATTVSTSTADEPESTQRQ
jgi:hypothetical protein